jgi:hypothetical protein
MKILKILFILLVPALLIVSCRKSDVKPDGSKHECNKSSSTQSSDPNNNNVGQAAGRGTSVDETEPEFGNIVGAGDDDRDGGDRKKIRR